ncbi:MAG: sugar transferase [bacterium]|nr:sugar transferase [bacterium]
MKRLADIICGSIGLIISAPLWPIIALAIKLETLGPAIVKLDRVSGGRVIKVYKFRSMVDGAHDLKPKLKALNQRLDGPFFKIKHDPRLTKIGKIIRKFRLDEIPQFLNVLKGDLSLVGPRPHEPQEVIYYPWEYKHLILAKSGLTGLSQVSGASSLPFLKELELDSHYVQNRSGWMDAKIIAKTAAIMFFDPTAV